jgi:type I restriction enzyme R subunit
VDEVRRVIRASLGNRAKESLVVDFINQTDLDQIGDKASVIDAFFTFAQAEQQREAQEALDREFAENLNAEAAAALHHHLDSSGSLPARSWHGSSTPFLPKMSPLNPQYLTRSKACFRRSRRWRFVEKFKGVWAQRAQGHLFGGVPTRVLVCHSGK